jgi:nucleotide-binding universal stress UspA family protein
MKSMNETYTVGYDGSAASHRAIMWAAAEAELTGAAVSAVSCYQTPMVPSPWMVPVAYDDALIRQTVAESLAAAVAKARELHPDVRFDERVEPGAPSRLLVEVARDSALLVVGSTGAGAAESWLLGSVAHAVARTSHCPVAIVPSREPGTATNTVVVGIDGSPAADEALIWAVDEADRRDAELVVVHAWEYPYGTELASPTVLYMTRVDAALVLDAALERCRDRGRGPICGELVEGNAAEAIVEHAHRADLVVVGSRGRGSFRSLLFGSVAHRVSEHAPCPVVIVRPADGRR